MMAVKRMSMLTHAAVEQKLTPRAQELAKDLNRYMADSEQVRLYLFFIILDLTGDQEHVDEEKSLVHHHGAEEDSDTSSSLNSHSTPPTSPDAKREEPLPAVDAGNASVKSGGVSPLAAQFKNASLKDD